MALEGGYAAAGQFKAIADQATASAMAVANMATNFAAITTSIYSMSNAVQAFANLEQTLVLTQSVAQGSAEQFRTMSNAVRDFALAYKVTAADGASALYALASAGYTTQQSLQAMNGVMQYAQGTLTDTAHAADTLSASMTAFGLAASEANNVANLFMASIAVSQASPEKLAYAMRQVAPVAAAMSTSITQTVAALSELFNVGNRGQQAGTLLRDVMLRLSAPTGVVKEMFNELGIAIQTTTGESRNFIEIMKDIQKLNLTVTSLKDIFDSRGVVGAKVLLETLNEDAFSARTTPGNQKFDEGYAQKVNDANKVLAERAKAAGTEVKVLRTEFDLMMFSLTNTQMATRIANAQLTTLASSFALAKNAVTEVGLTLGTQLAPALASSAGAITDAVIAFRGLNSSTRNLIIDLPLLAVGAYAAVKAIGAMVSLSTSLATATDPFGFRRSWENLRNLNGEFRTFQQFTNANGDILSRSFSQRGNPVYRGPNGQFVAPSQVTTTAMNSYTNQPASGASLIGAGLGVIGTVLTVASIAAIAYQVIPAVYTYFRDRGKPDADIDVKDYGKEAGRIISSTALGGATDIEKYKQIKDQIEQITQAQKDLNDTTKINENATLKAQEALRNYLAARADAMGKSDVASQLRAGASTEPAVNAGQAGLEGMQATSNLDDFLNQMAGDKKTEDYKKQVAQAAANIEARKKSADTIAEALKKYREYEATLLAKDGMADRVKFDDIKKANLAIEQEGVFTWQSGTIARAMEKDARAAKLQLDKLTAELSTNPVEVMSANISNLNEAVVKKWEDWATAEGKKIDDQYSSLYANSDLGKALTGQSYFVSKMIDKINDSNGQTETVFQRVKDQSGNFVRIKGALDILKEGGSDEQVKAALEEALKERVSALEAAGKSVPENIRALVERMKNASAEMVVSWLNSRNVEIQQEVAHKIDSQRQNFLLVSQLRDAMQAQQTAFLTQIFSASGSTDYSVRMKIDTMNINKQFEDALKQLDEQEKAVLKQLIGKYKEDTTVRAQWEEFKRASIDIATRTREDALRNLVAANTNAQTAAINMIRNATDAARVGESTFAGQLEAFLTATGQGVPKSLQNTRSQDITREQYAKIDSDIRATQEARDKLVEQIGVLSRSRGQKELPSFSISPPDSTVGPVGKANIGDTAYRELTDKLNQEVERLEGYKKMQESGIDAYKAIETTQVIINGLKEKLGQSTLLPEGANGAPPAPPRIQTPTVDSAATDSTIAALNRELAAMNAKLQAQEAYRQSVAQTSDAVNEAANKANSAYRQEQSNLDEMKRLYERNGSVMQGLQYAIGQISHTAKTDFQIAADAFTSFANTSASNLTDLITGQQKDWKVALSNIARDIASTILKALMLRSISGIFGGAGLPTNILPNANGNAFGGGRVIPFASGGVLPGPTYFGMAGGNIGLGGEAGEEALMPLKRGKDGKLGVTLNMPVMSPSTQGRQSGGGNLIFSPQYNFGNLGSDGVAQPSSSSRQTRDQMIAMKRDLERETEATVGKVIRKYQRPGGELAPY